MKRIVVVETVHFQGEGEPVTIDSRWSKVVASEDQPYVRRFKVGAEWQRLDEGWVRECSQLTLSHESPSYQVNPTEEQRKEDETVTIEVGLRMADGHVEPALLLPSRESLRVRPKDSGSWFVRSTGRPAWCTVSVFPR